jgi:hypothetical protein
MARYFVSGLSDEDAEWLTGDPGRDGVMVARRLGDGRVEIVELVKLLGLGFHEDGRITGELPDYVLWMYRNSYPVTIECPALEPDQIAALADEECVYDPAGNILVMSDGDYWVMATPLPQAKLCDFKIEGGRGNVSDDYLIWDHATSETVVAVMRGAFRDLGRSPDGFAVGDRVATVTDALIGKITKVVTARTVEVAFNAGPTMNVMVKELRHLRGKIR